MTVLIHPHAKERLQSILKPGAYIVQGSRGSGRTTAVSHILGDYQQYYVRTEERSIKIDAIHAIVRQLHLKNSEERLAIIIDDAEKMTHAAQNALLKTLEELPEYAILVLIVENMGAILPTIHSRCQNIFYQPPEFEQILSWAQERFPDTDTAQLKDALSTFGPLPAKINNHFSESKSSDSTGSDKISDIETLLEGELNQRLRAAQSLQPYLPEVLDDIIAHVRTQTRAQPNVFWADMSNVCVYAQQLSGSNANKRHILDVIALRGWNKW